MTWCASIAYATPVYTGCMPDNQVPANNSMQILPEGIIELTQTGYQTLDSINMFHAPIDDATAELHKQGKKAVILVDISGVTGQEPQVITTVRQRLAGEYDAMAIYGNSSTLQMIVNWVLKAIGNNQRVQYFSDKEAAKKWLLSR